MRYRLKHAFLFCLLAFLLSASPMLAQDTLTVVGSGLVNAAVASLAETIETEAISITVTGTTAGLDQFCKGRADIAAASRAITAAEDALCRADEVAYSEFLIAHSILAFAAHPTAPRQCLTESELDDLFKPSAAHQLRDWSSYDETLDELPITFIVPQDNQGAYVILDSLIAGDGLRRDALPYEDPQEAMLQVSQTPGAIAALPFSSQLAAAESLVVLELASDTADCAAPSAENVENRHYSAAQPLFVYVNQARLAQNPALAALIGFITSQAAADGVAEAGFTPPSRDTYALNAAILSNDESGRLISGAESQFTIPPNLSGHISISGSASAYGLLNAMAGQLTRQHEQLNIDFSMSGQNAGLRRLCADETDIAVLESELAADALQACQDNSVSAFPLPIGAQAAVLLGNAADERASCLTTAHIRTIWHTESAGQIQDWADLDATFPEQKMTLFGADAGDEYADMLMRAAGQAIPPIRRDIETNRDPLYRAAAVGNVPGALAYMSWADYQRVLANEQANIQLVAVDGGAGCIRPSKESITSGAYPLSRSASLLVNEGPLAEISLQSYLWRLFSEEGWSRMEDEGFVGINFVDLAALRSSLETQFSLAQAKAAEASETAEDESESESEADSSD